MAEMLSLRPEDEKSLYPQALQWFNDQKTAIELEVPTYGEQMVLDDELFEKLRSGGEILARIAPLVLKEKYLVGKDYVLTNQLHQSSLKTPGETRLLNRAVLEEGIIEGVCSGLFGLGEITNDQLVCRYYREQPSVAFSASEVIICEAVSVEQQVKKTKNGPDVHYPPTEPETLPGIGEKEPKWGKTGSQTKSRDKVRIRFEVPKGKVSSIMGVMNLLQSKFNSLEVEIVATDGEMSERDYEDKIMEAFRQLGIEVDETWRPS